MVILMTEEDYYDERRNIINNKEGRVLFGKNNYCQGQFPSINDDWIDSTPFLYRLDERHHYPPIKMTSKKYISGSAPRV